MNAPRVSNSAINEEKTILKDLHSHANFFCGSERFSGTLLKPTKVNVGVEFLTFYLMSRSFEFLAFFNFVAVNFGRFPNIGIFFLLNNQFSFQIDVYCACKSIRYPSENCLLYHSETAIRNYWPKDVCYRAY